MHPTVYKALRLEVVPLSLGVETKPVEIIHGNSVVQILPENINITTNGNLNDVICSVGDSKFGELLIDSKKVTSFTPGDLETGQLVFILKIQMASEDGFEVDCKSVLGPNSLSKVSINVVSGLSLKVEKFMLNPGDPTKFDLTLFDLPTLEAFTPLKIDFVTSEMVKAFKLETDENEGINLNLTSNDLDCFEFNGFDLCATEHFDTNQMKSGEIFLVNQKNSTEIMPIKLFVSADGIPRIPFSFNSEIRKETDLALLPNFGIPKSEISPEISGEKSPIPTKIPGKEGAISTPTFDIEAITADEVKKDERKISLDENGAYDSSESQEDPEITLGNLLYIIPLALLCVLGKIFLFFIFL